MKRTGLSNGQPDSLYRRDSPWISSYHIQNSFQLHITVILRDKTQQKFNYYIIQRIVVRNHLVQAHWAKREQPENGSGN